MYTGCMPSIYQNTIHRLLDQKQFLFLNRGPTYVSPCQLHTLSYSTNATNSLDQLLQKQLGPLRRQIAKLFREYPIDLSRRKIFQDTIQTLFNNLFSIPIPPKIKQRASEEKQLILSIRHYLKQNRLILRRTADDYNTYYLGSLDDFNSRSQEYLENSTNYEIHGVLDENNNEQQQLDAILQSIDSSLNTLKERKLITEEHIKKLSLHQQKKVQIPTLYFLPNIEHDHTYTVQPRLPSSEHNLMHHLATYLDQILRPIFNEASQLTMFSNGEDFLRKLQSYCCQQYNSFDNKTYFVTFEIHNLYTNLSHKDILIAVSRLLAHRSKLDPIDGLNHRAIEELTFLFLQNQIFTYNQRIYRHINGCPLNFSLNRLLFNIYLHQWQLNSLQRVRMANEFYGLYHNTGFLTWRQPIDKLQTILNEINAEFHSSIYISTSIDTNVHFLNVYIENLDGELYTRVYHDPNKQLFLLPYATGHPRLIHRKWFRFALIRAALYCSSLEDFHAERQYIQSTFLANGYSVKFVEYHTQKFFQFVYPMNTNIVLDRYRYNSIRTFLFRYVQSQTKDCIRQQEKQLMATDQPIHFYYLYDWGWRHKFNGEFQKKWTEIIEKDSNFKNYGFKKVQLSTKHCYLSNDLLTHSTE